VATIAAEEEESSRDVAEALQGGDRLSLKLPLSGGSLPREKA